MRINIFSFIFPLLCSGSLMAQEQQEVARCTDKEMHAQLVSVDDEYEEKGYEVIQFNLMSMPSGSFVPVAIQVEQGRQYQVYFLADQRFQQYSFALIDKDRNKLVDKRVKHKASSEAILAHNFKASYTGTVWLVLSLKVKGQAEACGGVSILKADN